MTMADQGRTPKYPRQLTSDSVEIKMRINKVIDLMIKGWSNRKIIEWAAKEFDVSPGTASKYVHDAILEVHEANGTFDIAEMKDKYIERIEGWMADAVASKNIKLAMNLQDMLNKMNKMYVDVQEVRVDGHDIHFNFDTQQK